jgi:hypothetical protein
VSGRLDRCAAVRTALSAGADHDAVLAAALLIATSPPAELRRCDHSVSVLQPAPASKPAVYRVQRLLRLGEASAVPMPERIRLLRSDASDDPSFRDGALGFVAGGTADHTEDRMRSYGRLLGDAFAGYTGTIVSGGTASGVAGIVGDIAARSHGRVTTVGYVPATTPTGAPEPDPRYDTIRRTAGTRFTVLECVQAWTDILVSEIDPSRVFVVGVGGGEISSAEYRIALALGARVGVVSGSGRAAAELLEDGDWNGFAGLEALRADPLAIARFIGVEER